MEASRSAKSISEREGRGLTFDFYLRPSTSALLPLPFYLCPSCFISNALPLLQLFKPGQRAALSPFTSQDLVQLTPDASSVVVREPSAWSSTPNRRWRIS